MSSESGTVVDYISAALDPCFYSLVLSYSFFFFFFFLALSESAGLREPGWCGPRVVEDAKNKSCRVLATDTFLFPNSLIRNCHWLSQAVLGRPRNKVGGRSS